MAATQTIEVVAHSIAGDSIFGPEALFRTTAIAELRSKLAASRQPCSGLVRVALAFEGQMLEDSSPVDMDRLECTAMFKREELTQEQRQRCIGLLREKVRETNRRQFRRNQWGYQDGTFVRMGSSSATTEEAVAAQLSQFSDVACSDAEVVMEAIRTSAQSFKFAHAKLRTNREYVCKAVKQSGMALQFASSELQGDRQLVLDAVRQEVKALQFVSAALCKDRDFLEEAIFVNKSALSYIPIDVDYDWLMSMTNSAIDDSSDVFESVDRPDALRKARAGSGMWLAEAIEFQSDKEIVLAALEQNPKALRFTSLLGDREVVLAAVRRDGMMLEFADESLRRDHEIVCTAIRSNPRARRFAIDKPLFDVLDTDLEDGVESPNDSRKRAQSSKRSKSAIAGLKEYSRCRGRRGAKQR
jgi:hypothetical protein